MKREYKGRSIIVKVFADGFEFDGEIYQSRSAIASEVTGTKWNGFRLAQEVHMSMTLQQRSSGTIEI